MDHPDLPLDLIESKMISWLQMEFFPVGTIGGGGATHLVLVGKRSACLHPSNYDPRLVDGSQSHARWVIDIDAGMPTIGRWDLTQR